MKKCASCTKDLPDAALHCVFCGAKQPPAPATAGGMAKTVMGSYSASDMMDHLKQQGHPPPPPPAAPPYRPSPAPPAPPAYPQPPNRQPPPHAPAPLAPAAGANAATMFAPPSPGQAPAPQAPRPAPAPAGAFGAGGAPAPAFSPAAVSPAFGPHGHPIGTNPSHVSSVPLAAPIPPPQVVLVPSAAPPYLASQTAARAGRPIEPWRDSMRTNMFIWGALLLVAFATPLALEPKLFFMWDIIANEAGTAKLPPLILAAVGILSLAIAGIPMSPAPRGIIAALLGLAGVLVPMFLPGMPPWQSLVPVAGLIILIPSLLVRHEYRDSMMPRVLVTVGVIATLAPLLIPINGRLPLVDLFKMAIEAPGSAKLLVLVVLAQIAIVVLSLLAWMPAPSSGGAKIFAWMIILSPVVVLVSVLVVTGLIEHIPDSPAIADSWVWASPAAGLGKNAAAGAPMGFGFGAAYAVLIGYGLASVIGKKLE